MHNQHISYNAHIGNITYVCSTMRIHFFSPLVFEFYFFIRFLHASYLNFPLRRKLSSYIQHGLIWDIDCSASVCQVVLELEPINC